jgi:dTDP-4-amino-4,6-dideoxygalactose transaminase
VADLLSNDHEPLERLTSRASYVFETEDSVATTSGAAAVLAACSALSGPLRSALVPGWICQSVLNAVLLAGMRPVLTDIDDGFSMVEPDVVPEDIALVLYAPYGGHAPDLEYWLGWADRRNVPLLLDFAHVADIGLWRDAARSNRLMVTSFKGSKPISALGGGLLTGPAELVDRAHSFVRGGLDSHGGKTGLGLDLRMPPAEAVAAEAALRRFPELTRPWREATRRELRQHGGLFKGWAESAHALSRIPRLNGRGLPLNPEATMRSRGWRDAVAARFPENPVQPPPRHLENVYDLLRLTKVRPQ